MAMTGSAIGTKQYQADAPKSIDMEDVLQRGRENDKYVRAIAERVCAIADHLLGAIPRPAGDERSEPGSGIVGQLNLLFRDHGDALEEISGELSRIERGLGIGVATQKLAG